MAPPTKASKHTRDGSVSFTCEDLPSILKIRDAASDDIVVIIENIDSYWWEAITREWMIEPSFFKRHADRTATHNPWKDIFGLPPMQREKPTVSEHLGLCWNRAQSWHVDGVFISAQSSCREPVNHIPRAWSWNASYGLNVLTRTSLWSSRTAYLRLSEHNSPRRFVAGTDDVCKASSL